MHSFPTRRSSDLHRADNGKDIDRMPDRAVDTLADQGIKRRAQRKRQPMPVGKKGQCQPDDGVDGPGVQAPRSEEHTSELQSLMRSSYSVFCTKKKLNNYNNIRIKQRVKNI